MDETDVIEVVEDKIVTKEVWVVRNKMGRILRVSEREIQGADKLDLLEEEANAILNTPPAKAWVIRDGGGKMLYKAFKPINDPRAVEVTATDKIIDEELPSDIVWVVDDPLAGVPSLCDTYPLDPAATPMARNSAEVKEALRQHKQIRDDFMANKERRKRALERLIDGEIAKNG